MPDDDRVGKELGLRLTRTFRQGRHTTVSIQPMTSRRPSGIAFSLILTPTIHLHRPRMHRLRCILHLLPIHRQLSCYHRQGCTCLQQFTSLHLLILLCIPSHRCTSHSRWCIWAICLHQDMCRNHISIIHRHHTRLTLGPGDIRLRQGLRDSHIRMIYRGMLDQGLGEEARAAPDTGMDISGEMSREGAYGAMIMF
jgi:hypothetical protein